MAALTSAETTYKSLSLSSRMMFLFAVFLFSIAIDARADKAAVDGVLASVNGEPITLTDVFERLPGTHPQSLQEAIRDPGVRTALDAIILEKLVQAEATSRRIGVSQAEVDAYVDEVARRNQLSKKGFEEALQREGRSLQEYRRQIESDILRSKLASSFLKNGVGVTEKEIDEYLEQSSDFSKEGAKLKLRQIMVSTGGRTEEEAKERIEKLESKLESDNSNFASIAEEGSDGSESSQGGLLGVLAEKDLNSAIFDAVFALEAGQRSKVVRTPLGYHIFFVEERFVDGESAERSEEVRNEVRKILEDRKLESRMRSFFEHEIFELNAVDKKI
ncbi:MAG: peptidylprolyl isomerase [Bdellovibrionales bacterium]|nr:peptidylprolyl isomerase [Bdellovibrionales bacterium]